EDVIRVDLVTGVQTCALPIFIAAASLGFFLLKGGSDEEAPVVQATPSATFAPTAPPAVEQLGESYRMIIDKIGLDAPVVRYGLRSEERRVGRECRMREGKRRG